MGTMSLRDVIEALGNEGLLDDRETALTYLRGRSDAQPWYVRAMVAFGAWLASLLLIGFVVGFSFAMEGGYAIIGLLLIGGATVLRHRADGDFPSQSALAASLAGQALFAFGIAETVGHDEFESYLGIVLVTSLVLFVVFPDRIHRVLMVLLAVGSLTGLLYAWEANALIPVLGPALTGVLILLDRQMPRLVGSRHAVLVRPLMNGLLLAAFGVLLISTIYILPELGVNDFVFYPRPWISTLLLGGLLLYVCSTVWPVVAGDAQRAALPMLHGMTVVVIACAWAAPGLLLGMIVVLLGAASGHKTYTGAGIAFIAVFLTAYFYGIEVTMLTKSAVLIATGSALLLVRWIIRKILTSAGSGGSDHA